MSQFMNKVKNLGGKISGVKDYFRSPNAGPIEDNSSKGMDKAEIQIVIPISKVDYSAAANKWIGGLKGRIIGAASSLLPRRSVRKRVIKGIEGYKHKIIQEMNSYLRNENISLTVKDLYALEASSPGMELEFHLTLGDIDYVALIYKAWEYRQNFIKDPVLLASLNTIGRDRISEMSAKILGFLSQNTRNGIVETIVSQNEGKIRQSLSEFVEKEGWALEFSKLEVKALQSDGKLEEKLEKFYIIANVISFPFYMAEIVKSSLWKFLAARLAGSKIDVKEMIIPSAIGIWMILVLISKFIAITWQWLLALTLILILTAVVAYRLCNARQGKEESDLQCKELYDSIHRKFLTGLALVYFPAAIVIFISLMYVHISMYGFIWIMMAYAYSLVLSVAPVFYIYLICSGVISLYVMKRTPKAPCSV